jgi:hypothetical protein
MGRSTKTAIFIANDRRKLCLNGLDKWSRKCWQRGTFSFIMTGASQKWKGKELLLSDVAMAIGK